MNSRRRDRFGRMLGPLLGLALALFVGGDAVGGPLSSREKLRAPFLGEWIATASFGPEYPMSSVRSVERVTAIGRNGLRAVHRPTAVQPMPTNGASLPSFTEAFFPNGRYTATGQAWLEFTSTTMTVPDGPVFTNFVMNGRWRFEGTDLVSSGSGRFRLLDGSDPLGGMSIFFVNRLTVVGQTRYLRNGDRISEVQEVARRRSAPRRAGSD